jgi:hypothetical protein
MMAKLRYEIDPHNRLIVNKTERKTDIPRFRHIIEGRFKIGKDNILLYHIKAPSRAIANELNLPHQLKLKGRWSLTAEHNLRLTLNKWHRQTFGDELTLKGEIIKIGAHSLLFAITQRTKENTAPTYILKLEGNYQADKNNRLTFRVKKEGYKYDALIFGGIWNVNREHQIIYHYRKYSRNRIKEKKHSLLFNGFWYLKKTKVLTYQLVDN